MSAIQAAREAFELLVVHMSMYDSQGALNCERAVLAAFPALAEGTEAAQVVPPIRDEKDF